MVTLPPPAPPAVTATQALPTPTSIPVQLNVASVTSTVAALQQRVVVSVLAVTVDLQQQLLNILTPQGTVGLRLPVTPQQLTLPNGQPAPLQTVLANLANLTPAQIKSGLQLVIEPQGSGTNPTARLLLAPEVLNTRPASPLTQQPVATQQLQQSTLRTLALPLPPEVLATLPPLTPQQAAAAAIPDSTLMTKFLNALKGTPATPAAGIQQSITTPNTPINTTTLTLSPEALAKGGKPVEILGSPQQGTLAATIVGTTARGDTIVQTANGTAFSLSHIRGGAVGDTLYIKPTTDLPPEAQGALEENIPPALREALDILETINPALAARVVTQTTLPLHTLHAPQVASSMLFFLTAMGGTFTAATQQTALHAMLERTLPRAARDKLLAELQTLTRTVADSTGIEWRGHTLPTSHLEGLHGPVWFYVQQRSQGNHNDGNAPTNGGHAPRQTRFLIDLELTRLGHTQLEGIAAHNKVDLKLNTRTPLPRDMQNELVQIYAGAATAYGFAGELIFTNGALIDMRRGGSAATTV